MSENAEEITLNQLTLFAGASPVRIYRWLADVLAWLENGADSGSSLHELLRSFIRDGLLSRMSPAFYPATKGETWEYSPDHWPNSATGGPIGCLTLNTSEWPRDAAVCSLSEVLEQDVPQKFFLSPRAAKGILRRAEKRGRELPQRLTVALTALAAQGHPEPM